MPKLRPIAEIAGPRSTPIGQSYRSMRCRTCGQVFEVFDAKDIALHLGHERLNKKPPVRDGD